MRVLVDTSVWSAALRRSRGDKSTVATELKALICEHRVEIIGPVRQEILSGIREEAHFTRLQEHLQAFPDLPLSTDDYVTAAKYYNACRARGIQGSNTDFLLCSVAVRNSLAIFTTDGDFSLFSRHLPIVLHKVREPQR